jgi:hypothetical protein
LSTTRKNISITVDNIVEQTLTIANQTRNIAENSALCVPSLAVMVMVISSLEVKGWLDLSSFLLVILKSCARS